MDKMAQEYKAKAEGLENEMSTLKEENYKIVVCKRCFSIGNCFSRSY